MSFKKTLFLFCVLAVALIYIYKIEIPHRKGLEKKDFLFKVLETEQVESVELLRGATSFTLVNTDPVKLAGEGSSSELNKSNTSVLSNWEFTEPKGAKVESSILNGIISALQQIKLDSEVPAEDLDGDLAPYGLKTPELIVKVKSAGVPFELQFGKFSAFLNKRYLKLASGGGVFLVPEYQFTSLNKSKEDLRDRTPVDFLDSEVKKITISNKKESVVIERDADKRYQIKEPISAIADEEIINGILRELRNVRVDQFIDETSDLSRYKLISPDAKLLIEFGDDKKKAPLELSFSTVPEKANESSTGKHYAFIKDSPSILVLTTDPVPNVLKNADSLRQRRLFRFPVDRVKRLIIESSESPTVTVEKANAQWKVGDKQGDDVFIQQYLSDLSQTAVDTFLSPEQKRTIDKPVIKISVELEGVRDMGDANKSTHAEQSTPEVITKSMTVGEEIKLKDKRVYRAQFSGMDEAISISEEMLKKLRKKEETFVVQSVEPTPTASDVSQKEN